MLRDMFGQAGPPDEPHAFLRPLASESGAERIIERELVHSELHAREDGERVIRVVEVAGPDVADPARPIELDPVAPDPLGQGLGEMPPASSRLLRAEEEVGDTPGILPMRFVPARGRDRKEPGQTLQGIRRLSRAPAKMRDELEVAPEPWHRIANLLRCRRARRPAIGEAERAPAEEVRATKAKDLDDKSAGSQKRGSGRDTDEVIPALLIGVERRSTGGSREIPRLEPAEANHFRERARVGP